MSDFDITGVQFTPSWFAGAVLAVIFVLGAIAVGTYAYKNLKGLVSDSAEAF